MRIWDKKIIVTLKKGEKELAKTQETLIREEQEILDDFIRDMDSALLALDDETSKKDGAQHSVYGARSTLEH